MSDGLSPILRLLLCDLRHDLRKPFLGLVTAEFAGKLAEAVGLTLGWRVRFLHGMSLAENVPEPYYIAYIDEAGDPGLNTVRPIDPNGSSEWLALGAVLIQAARGPELVEWVRKIRAAINLRQRPDLHFRKLSPDRRIIVCQHIADLALRGFVLLSNKKNMRRHRNTAAERFPSQEWYYNFCVRLLLERVTDFVERRSIKDYGEPRPLKLILSERGGIKYIYMKAYHQVIAKQSAAGALYLPKRDVKWSVMDHRLTEVIAHNRNPGLQLADAVTSAFYRAADALGPGKWDVEPARALMPRMATERGVYADYGVALQPTPPRRAMLTEEQQVIFRDYGYVFRK